MKKQFINTLAVGNIVDDIFALSKKSLAQKKDGNNFLNVTLTDKTGNIKGVVWDNVDEISANVKTGDFVHVEGNISEYNGNLQLVIKKMKLCPAELSPDSSDFIPRTPRNTDAMFDRLVKMVNNFIKDKYLKQLLEAFWNDKDFVRKFKDAPAAKKMHHNYIGGLLEHTLSMASLVEKITGHYSGIDMELLMAGAIFHDIGKIREFDYSSIIDYSDEGRLLSHIVIGCQMLDEKIQKIKDFPQEKALLLRHMIISHHGAREFGSPELPKTIEAVLLNYIDEIDAKVNGIRDFMSKEDSNGHWTPYHNVLGRHFYKGNK